MDEQNHQVLTVEEVASYLRIPKPTVYKLAQEGKIPCKKVGRQWRFHQSAIDHWLSSGSDALQAENKRVTG